MGSAPRARAIGFRTRALYRLNRVTSTLTRLERRAAHRCIREGSQPTRLPAGPFALYLPHPNRSAEPVANNLLVAAAALIDADGRVLICKRPRGKQLEGMWEFPGGKVDEGETPEECLIRELDEELGIKVTHACLAPFVFTSHGYDSFHLLMPLYLCRRWEGLVTAREHEAIAWVRPDKLSDYPMPPADLPLVAWLRDML